MSVRIDGTTIRLEGACLVEDAEPLLRALQMGLRVVDLAEATRLHTAVVQLLLAVRPELAALPADPFLRDHVLNGMIKSNAAHDGTG